MYEHINRQLRATGRRPRLRSQLSSIQKESRSVFGMDTFLSWCQCIRFPNVFSLHTKHKLYFLMSQHPQHVDRPHTYVQHITKDSFVCAALVTVAVQKPEHDVLHKVISSMRLIEEPFTPGTPGPWIQGSNFSNHCVRIRNMER
jgi:hypothetical protein